MAEGWAWWPDDSAAALDGVLVEAELQDEAQLLAQDVRLHVERVVSADSQFSVRRSGWHEPPDFELDAEVVAGENYPPAQIPHPEVWSPCQTRES